MANTISGRQTAGRTAACYWLAAALNAIMSAMLLISHPEMLHPCIAIGASGAAAAFLAWKWRPALMPYASGRARAMIAASRLLAFLQYALLAALAFAGPWDQAAGRLAAFALLWPYAAMIYVRSLLPGPGYGDGYGFMFACLAVCFFVSVLSACWNPKFWMAVMDPPAARLAWPAAAACSLFLPSAMAVASPEQWGWFVSSCRRQRAAVSRVLYFLGASQLAVVFAGFAFDGCAAGMGLVAVVIGHAFLLSAGYLSECCL